MEWTSAGRTSAGRISAGRISARANLSRANLSGADLGGANLSRADLSWTDLSEADLGGARLTRAQLRGAGLIHANLRGTDLRRAELSEADLSGADLSWAKLSGTEMRMADLSDTDLTEVSGLMVDSCRIVHARFSPNAKDPWSILRRTYTGTNLILNLLLILLFFAPLVIKGAGSVALGDAERRAVDALNRLDRFRLGVDVAKPDRGIISTARAVELRVAGRSQPMWRLLIGAGGPYGMIMPVLTVLLIAYQIAHYLMTRHISLMRDTEERSGISPPLEGVITYPRLYRVHQVLTVIFWTGAAAFALRAIEFLFLTKVPVPV